MRKVSHKSCTEKQNTHFMFSNVIPQFVPFIRQCGNTWKSRTGQRWQYGACALHAK